MPKPATRENTKTATEFWDDLADFHTCMLGTNDGNQLRSRPMSPHVRADAGEIRFLSSIRTHKVKEIEANPSANAVFSDDGGLFLSVSGCIRLSRATADIDDLWSQSDEVWLDDDREAAIVLIFYADNGEYWEVPCSLQATWQKAKAAVTGEPAIIGSEGKLAL